MRMGKEEENFQPWFQQTTAANGHNIKVDICVYIYFIVFIFARLNRYNIIPLLIRERERGIVWIWKNDLYK